ncbi:hypothetical protein FMEAI12_5590010 [Parafrankia sp. Ea1.12]|nr:hypothetical protein FMEAI12_5590010 [Parafrankia sp. Ea1.12]
MLFEESDARAWIKAHGIPAGRRKDADRRTPVVTDAPGEAVDEYEAGCRRSDESAGAHRSTSRRRQPTHRE